MATEFTNLPTPRSESPVLLKKPLQDELQSSSDSLVDNEGNVLSYPTYNKVQATKEKYCQPSPIPRLAKAAAFSNVIPTAGGYAISRCKEPQVDCPPSYLMYEDQPWVLGKMNPAALTDPEPEPESEEIVVEAATEELSKPIPQTPLPTVEDENNNIVPVEDIKDVPKVEDAKNAPKVDNVEGSQKVEDVKDIPKVESKPAPIKEPVAKDVKKLSKSRNASASPVRASRPSTGKSPRLQQQDKPKTPKSPGRNSDPAAKLSPRTGTKKTVNAKVDLEIEIDKKN
ncbi:hypothetical protein Ocin01_03373 [Orchesella cincta]|uniref:Uncharacterized protein n=1 Tax=Orchesella cincta TaxID=48709 RepID=A0A1D2NDW9_ORCCI|nr:hypothetical protein Ocin01_03373 [Orchesella cincta]